VTTRSSGAVIEGEQATAAVLSKEAAVRVGGFGYAMDQSVLDTLVVPLAVVAASG
jgi:hypothetical protein